MKIFKSDDVNDIYRQVARELVTNGFERNVRGLRTKEVSEEVCITLENPLNSVVTIPARHLDDRVYKYLEGEFKWFRSGDLSLAPIQPYATFWNKLANPDNTINSNYGYYTFKQELPEKGMSQFDWCVKKLQEDNFTRQALININQPFHKYLTNKDFCCTVGQHFLFRNGKLDSLVWMRSNDFIFGTTYNLPWFTWVHRLVAEFTGLPLGNYVHMVSSLHVYDNHYKMLDEMAASVGTWEEKSKANLIRESWKDFTDDKLPSFYEEAWKIHNI